MDTLFRDDADPKSNFTWIEKDYIECDKIEKVGDSNDKEEISDDDNSEVY